MITFRHNKLLLLLLVTAFLTVQWTAMHVHLAENHDHDGNHHQHNLQAHGHYTASHHVDTIESSHSIKDFAVVELDNNCALPACKKSGEQSTVSTSLTHQFSLALKPTSFQLPKLESNKQSYITYSTTRLRAPPQFS